MDSDIVRTVDEIRAELTSNRQNLTGATEDLVDSVKPVNIARRGIDDTKSFVASEFQTVKEGLRDGDGWRTDRLAITGGALFGVVLFAVTIYVLGRRNHEWFKKGPGDPGALAQYTTGDLNPELAD